MRCRALAMPSTAADPVIMALQRWHAAHPATAYAVAYSGGLDSHCLLHAAARLRLPGLRALHVQHGLQPAAEDWLRHCCQQASALDVPFQALRLCLPERPAQGIEAAARAARYAAFAAVLRPDECLLLAQHLDDQAETFLLQALRGAGVEGLAAMAATAPLGRGRLARPFLGLPRATLRRYAVQQGLRWVEDASNADTRFDRNWLRAEILPRLLQRWPGASATLARAARHCASAAEATRAAAAAALASLRGSGAPGNRLDGQALAALPEALQTLVLRAWIRECGLPLPAEKHLRRALALPMLRPDANPCIRWPGAQLRRYRQWLYVMPPLPPAPRQALPWDPQWPLRLQDSGLQLYLSAHPPHATPAVTGKVLALSAPALVQAPLSVRFRAGGERLRLAGETMSRSLKHLFQDWGLPPWQRERWPLLYAGQVLAAVPGYAVTAAFAAAPDTPARYLWVRTFPVTR